MTPSAEKIHGRVLLSDSDPNTARLLVSGLRRLGFDVDLRARMPEMFEALQHGAYDVVVAEARAAQMDGIALCQQLATRFAGLPVVLVGGYGSIELSVEAYRAGAFDFVNRPFAIEVLGHVLRRAIDHRRLNLEIARLRGIGAASPGVSNLYGNGSAKAHINGDARELPSMDEVERAHVIRVLQAAGGNKTTAAQILGFDRKTLYRKLERYGLHEGQHAPGASAVPAAG